VPQVKTQRVTPILGTHALAFFGFLVLGRRAYGNLGHRQECLCYQNKKGGCVAAAALKFATCTEHACQARQFYATTNGKKSRRDGGVTELHPRHKQTPNSSATFFRFRENRKAPTRADSAITNGTAAIP